MDLLDLTGNLILDHGCKLDVVAVTQPYLTSGPETEKLLGRIFHEVILFNIQLAREGQGAAAQFGLLRMVLGGQLFHLVFGVVVDDHLERLEYAQNPGGALIQVIADGVLEHGHVDPALLPAEPDLSAEVANRGRGVATPPEAGDGQHARIVPVRDVAFLHQLQEFALAHHGVGEVQTGKLDLLRVAGGGQGIQNPVIQRSMVLKLQCAEAVSDALDGI